MKKSLSLNKQSTGQNAFEGLLFIPDISGFTEFVRSTNVLIGKQVTSELLTEIISQNILRMRVSEIEGDAVLFYRNGIAPSIRQLFTQFERMTASFETKRIELERKYEIPLNLSLKVIAHYGSMAEFQIGSFRKLYGEVLVEAHRLLKNGVASSRYLLLTDSLFKMPYELFDSELKSHGIQSNRLCEINTGLRNLCFTYFDFSVRRSWREAA